MGISLVVFGVIRMGQMYYYHYDVVYQVEHDPDDQPSSHTCHCIVMQSNIQLNQQTLFSHSKHDFILCPTNKPVKEDQPPIFG